MKAMIFSALLLVAVGAQAEFVCKLKGANGQAVNPDTVYVDDSKIQEFLETMESMGIVAKCQRVQDA